MNNLQPTTYNLQPNKGQVMLLTVLILSGTILGATTIAGLLMLNQIRQSINITDSLQAIFAADAGLEYELFKLFKDSLYSKPILDTPADFVTETISTDEEIEFRSVGCSGALFESPPPGACPRPLNRSLQLFFVLVE